MGMPGVQRLSKCRLAQAVSRRSARTHARAAAAPAPVAKPSAPEGDVLIEFKDVWKSFGSKEVLRGCSFNVRRGEAVGIIGGSGTGKSTTLRLISGLLQPDKGQIIIKGRERVGLISDGDESQYNLKLGLVFQNAALFDSLTVLENVGFQLLEHSDLPRKEVERLVTENLNKVRLVRAVPDYGGTAVP